MANYIVGITGASGSIYAVRLLQELLNRGHAVHLVVTPNGSRVLTYELQLDLNQYLHQQGVNADSLIRYEPDDLFAAIASGSFKTDGMVVIPCSMATLGGIATGTSGHLLGRAADVCLKERRKLILVARETPLSTIHLRNMLSLSEAGAVLLPAVPGFYHHPQKLEDLVGFVVGKVLDSLNLEHQLFVRWQGQPC